MKHGGRRCVQIHIESVLASAVQCQSCAFLPTNRLTGPAYRSSNSHTLPRGFGGYMRLSVPNIPPSILANAALRNVPSVVPAEAVQRIASFLSSGTAAILTGAGVSVDSGVKAYRGKDGRYMNPDYKCAPLSLRFDLGDISLTSQTLVFRPIFVRAVRSSSFPRLVNSVCLCSTRNS